MFNLIRHSVRIPYIILLFLRYNLHKPLKKYRFITFLCKIVACIIKPRFIKYYRINKKEYGYRLRKCLEEAGPIYIKFGQILSTRNDIFPLDVTEELAKLQDNVPPFPTDQAINIIEESLQKPLKDIFKSFNEKPLASASIAQVYVAKLFNDNEVAVKILRPHIAKHIQNDMKPLLLIAKIIHCCWHKSTNLKPLDIIQELNYALKCEIDLVREGANACQLKRNFKHDQHLYIPKIFWHLSKNNILVMEKINGYRFKDIHKQNMLNMPDFNAEKFAELLILIFFRQVFEHSFFHADMHPGNIFFHSDLKKAQLIFVDFGIIGSLNMADQDYLAQNLVAFFKQDYLKVAKLHVESGWLPQETRIELFADAMRAVCEPIFSQPLAKISVSLLLLRLFQVAHNFNIRIQPQLIMLQKTLLNIESLAKKLYPQLNLWKVAEPFLSNWLQKKYSLCNLQKNMQNNYTYMHQLINNLPEKILNIEKIMHNNMVTKQKMIHEISKNNRKQKNINLILAIILSINLVYIYLHF